MAVDAATVKLWYDEAIGDHQDWVNEALIDYKYYRGKQWKSADRARLRKEKRPVITLNKIRRIIRLMVGYEQKTRYGIKCLPITGGDENTARLLTMLIKGIEYDNIAYKIYSDVYRFGIIAGRGFFNVDIDKNENMLGDIKINWTDPHGLIMDPRGTRFDLKDHKYSIKERWYDPDVLKTKYPHLEKEIDGIPGEADWVTETTGNRVILKVWETWYREYMRVKYLGNLETGDIFLIKDGMEDDAAAYVKNGTHTLIERIRPEVKWITICGNTELEKGDSPYAHEYFPDVPYFAEYTPRFGDEPAEWIGIVRDLRDAQDEKNKRRSQFMDMVVRLISHGWKVEKGALVDQTKLKDIGKSPGYIIETNPGKFDKVKRIESSSPDPVPYGD